MRARAGQRRLSWRGRADGRAGEGGSAPVEFVLVGVLLTVLFLAIVQLGLDLHVRNVLVASASEGARYGANADRAPADGITRTRELITTSLSRRFARDVSAGIGQADGADVVVIRVRAPLPVFAWYGPAGVLSVAGHAVREGS
jgi:Flp pilus assembly protein TadG